MKKLLILFICIYLNANETAQEFYKGFHSFYGLNGYKKDYKEAFNHFSIIEDKNENAKYYVMTIYKEGLGIEPNKEEYLKRYRELNFTTRYFR